MSKHTPGPWLAVGDWVEHPEQGEADICCCHPDDFGQLTFGRTLEECAANARLIAAAPAMLEALEMAVRQNEHDMLMTGEELRKCAAVIRAAKGEA